MTDNTELQTKLSSLKEAIFAAFKDSSYPGDNEIVFDESHCPDCYYVASLFRGKDWRELDVAELPLRSDLLPLLTPQAFKFFLPAFLCASLDAEGGDSFGAAILAVLSPPADPRRIQYFYDSVAHYTEGQKESIKKYFEFLYDERNRHYPIGNLDMELIIFWDKGHTK